MNSTAILAGATAIPPTLLADTFTYIRSRVMDEAVTFLQTGVLTENATTGLYQNVYSDPDQQMTDEYARLFSQLLTAVKLDPHILAVLLINVAAYGFQRGYAVGQASAMDEMFKVTE